MDLRGFRKRWAAAPLSSVGSPSTPALESEPAGAALEFADVDSGFALGNNPNASNSSTGFSLHMSHRNMFNKLELPLHFLFYVPQSE